MLTATQLQDAVLAVSNSRMFYGFEGRLTNYGAFQSALDGADLLLPTSLVKAMKNSPAQVTKVPVLNKQTLPIITERSCEITGNNPVSAFKALSYTTKGFEITVSESVADGNYISLADQFANGMINGLRTVFLALDTAAVASLETNKSAVLATSSIADQALGAYTLAGATGINGVDEVYYDIPTIMRLNDLSGRYANVMNTEATKNLLRYESQGQANSVNLNAILNGTVPSAGAYMHYLTNQITLAGNKEVHYVFPEGSFGVFQWNPMDFTKKRPTSDGLKRYTMEDPILGLVWNVSERTTCEDLSETYGAGYEAVNVTKYQFSVDLAFLTVYSSDTSSPIIKFNLSNPV